MSEDADGEVLDVGGPLGRQLEELDVVPLHTVDEDCGGQDRLTHLPLLQAVAQNEAGGPDTPGDSQATLAGSQWPRRKRSGTAQPTLLTFLPAAHHRPHGQPLPDFRGPACPQPLCLSRGLQTQFKTLST